MKVPESLKFYDPKSLFTMAMEVLSWCLPGRKSAEYTRKILGLQPYQTQLHNQYTDSQLIKILKCGILTLVGFIEKLAKDIIEKDAYIQHLEAENEKLLHDIELAQHKSDEKIQELQSSIHDLNTALEKIRRREKRHLANSENSSLPPSQNPISEKARIRKNNVSLRETSDKPNGGQPGHKGATLARKEDAQQKILLYPNKELSADSNDSSDVICPNCGKPIPRAIFTEKEAHQIIDIADNIKAIVTDCVRMEAVCPNCGQKVSGKFGPYAQGNVNYGPRLQAFVTLLSVRHSVAENRICEIISDLYGIKLNEGTVCNMLQRQTSYSRPEWYHLRDDICDSKNGIVAVHADETHSGCLYKRPANAPNTSQVSLDTKATDSPPDKIETESQTSGVKTNTNKKVKALPIWIWTFQNSRSIFLKHNMSRSSSLITKLFDNGLPGKILVTDRYRGYFTDEILVEGHQVCLTHLLRNIKSKMVIYPRFSWLSKLFKTIQQVIHRFNQKEDKLVLYDFYKKELHDYLYAETQKSELPDESAVVEIENFKKELRAHENHMLTFLTIDGVFPTNNAAEISLRSTKTKLKVSGNFRTEYGSYMYAVNGSIVQTAILNKENVYHKLLEIALKAETVDELAPWDQELLPLNTKTQSKQKGV